MIESSADPDGTFPHSWHAVGSRNWLIRATACVVTIYQIWWSLQVDAAPRQMAETCWQLQTGADPALLTREVSLAQIWFPYLLGYWLFLVTGLVCLWFPQWVGRWLCIDLERHSPLPMAPEALRQRGRDAAPIAWLMGWFIVFMLPGILMMCGQSDPR